jgi:hypothetical protein
MRKLATHEGIIENGRVTLPPNTEIPDKTRVYVLVPDAEPQPAVYVTSPRLAPSGASEKFQDASY